MPADHGAPASHVARAAPASMPTKRSGSASPASSSTRCTTATSTAPARAGPRCAVHADGGGKAPAIQQPMSGDVAGRALPRRPLPPRCTDSACASSRPAPTRCPVRIARRTGRRSARAHAPRRGRRHPLDREPAQPRQAAAPRSGRRSLRPPARGAATSGMPRRRKTYRFTDAAAAPARLGRRARAGTSSAPRRSARRGIRPARRGAARRPTANTSGSTSTCALNTGEPDVICHTCTSCTATTRGAAGARGSRPRRCRRGPTRRARASRRAAARARSTMSTAISQRRDRVGRVGARRDDHERRDDHARRPMRSPSTSR